MPDKVDFLSTRNMGISQGTGIFTATGENMLLKKQKTKNLSIHMSFCHHFPRWSWIGICNPGAYGLQGKSCYRDFPDSPMVKTLHFHCREWVFNPWLKTKIPHATWCSQKQKLKQSIIEMKVSFSLYTYMCVCVCVCKTIMWHLWREDTCLMLRSQVAGGAGGPRYTRDRRGKIHKGEPFGQS